MDTALEALVRDMLNHGWFSDATGDVEAPTGFFGYVVACPGSAPEVYDEFADTVSAYGTPDPAEVECAMVASINSDGILRIERFDNDADAKLLFWAALDEYHKWLDA